MSEYLDSLLDAERRADIASHDLIPEGLMRDMAEEKLCADADTFTDWLTAECMGPTERRACHFFGPISTASLVTEVLLQRRATDEQIAAAVRELRSRFVLDNADAVSREFDRLRSEVGQ